MPWAQIFYDITVRLQIPSAYVDGWRSVSSGGMVRCWNHNPVGSKDAWTVKERHLLGDHDDFEPLGAMLVCTVHNT